MNKRNNPTNERKNFSSIPINFNQSNKNGLNNFDTIEDKPKERYDEYDKYRIKHIIKENLAEKNKNLKLLNKNNYEDFLDERIDIQSYLKEKNNESKSLENSEISQLSEFNNSNQNKFNSNLLTNPKINFEEINQLEFNAMIKAKELEDQIKEINRKRIELVIKDFKEKLIEEGKGEFDKFYKNLQDEFQTALLKINETHSRQINGIYELQNKINDYSDMLKSISVELKEQKILLNSNFEKYLDRMEKEKNVTVEKYKSDMKGYIENRVKIFEDYLNNQLNH